MQKPSDRKAVLARIHGRVQGVGYRHWTVKTALAIGGLSGWVRNRADGTVEALFAGTGSQVDEILDACKTGPALAKVVKIDITSVEYPAASGFKEEATL